VRFRHFGIRLELALRGGTDGNGANQSGS